MAEQSVQKRTTLAEAYHASDYETWTSYWKQCRITGIFYKYPLNTPDVDNPLWVRWREIPEGEDLTVPHPEIDVQQLETMVETELCRALIDSMPDDRKFKTFEEIEKFTEAWHNDNLQREKDFQEYLEYRANGNIKIETIDETRPITWDSIRNASTEELFQTKLEIFESPPVQECENKEYRQNIRKASSIIEAMYWYYLIVNGDVPEDTAEKIPTNIEVLLGGSSEQIFKWKLQLFEKENVQNSENKDARSRIRKAEDLVSLFAAYSEILNEGEGEEETPDVEAERDAELYPEEKE